jgi:predicted nucleic acid-binding protein
LSLASLQRSLAGVTNIALDTSIFIAAADASDERSSCAAWLTDAIERGRFQCTLSVVTAAELMVGGFRKSVEDGAARRAHLSNYPNLTIVPLSFDVATGAAHLRATTKLELPDAIVLATAIDAGCDAIVHGDREWIKRAKGYASKLRMVYLGDHCF